VTFVANFAGFQMFSGARWPSPAVKAIALALALALALASMRPAAAGGEDRLPPEEIAEAIVETDLELPSPAEWFLAFSKVDSARWRKLYREPNAHSVSDRHKAAIALGTLYTDAYIAVEARGVQQVRNVIQDLRVVEKMLGVGDKMQQRTARIADLATAEQWKAIRVELEASMREEALILRQQRDGALATLIPVGALLRTMHAGCSLVQDLELGDTSLALGDVTLVYTLLRDVEALPEETLEERSVRDVRRCLKHLRDCWQDRLEKPVADKVAETYRVLDAVLNSLKD